MVTEYVVIDRITGLNQSITITNSRLANAVTSHIASSEPIVQDTVNGSNHWKIFVSNGRIGIESTGTATNNRVVLYDSVTTGYWLLIVSNGRLGYTATTAPVVVIMTDIGGGGAKKRRKKLTYLYRTELNIDGIKAFPVSYMFGIYGKRKITLNEITKIYGTKIVQGDLELSLSGKTLFDFFMDLGMQGKRSFTFFSPDCPIKGTRQIDFSTCSAIYGTKIMENGYDHEFIPEDFVPMRRIEISDSFDLSGKVFNIMETRIELSGKRDITPILKALDLYE